ncbi:unnamed protein product [Clonostachys rhizophaga]|uniref:Uncharacterized protein n=1 Tax=Clonostachys rhizophaga TaxID=160324 RepID=A0A9N9UYK1_9HYPO|nr:unnamed protein product [Clonostachys rhizophaga]
MLDENLPTYRSRVSSDNPLNSILYYTHNGSEARPEYLLKRPAPGQAPNQYALGLFDVQYSSVVYAEVLVKPDWTQPTLSAAEVRANGGNAVALPVVPHSFSVSLYNPDQSITVRYQTSSWSKDAWEFEVPETSFKTPSASKIDQDAATPVLADLIPRLNFHWKRDSRMNRDMTCYMSGRTVGGKKAKEPDITVALFQAGKTEGAVAIYEPNMNRVEVEDRKGLELVLLLSAEVIRDLYLSPKSDPFNTAGSAAPSAAGVKAGKAPRKNSSPPLAMSGALNSATPASPQQQSQQQFAPPSRPPPQDARRAEIDAESKRLQKLVAEEKAMSRDRERQDREEQQRIREMLEREEREEKERRQREVDAETERLRREYGVEQPGRNGARSPPSPALPPRRTHGASMSGAGGGWSPTEGRPPRPQSVGPSSVQFTPDAQPAQQGAGGNGGRRQKLNQFLQTSPYAGPAAASVSGFFGGGARTEEEKQKKMKKKRSVHF